MLKALQVAADSYTESSGTKAMVGLPAHAPPSLLKALKLAFSGTVVSYTRSSPGLLAARVNRLNSPFWPPAQLVVAVEYNRATLTTFILSDRD